MTWRKSSYSGNSGGECVEVRAGLDAVRDSKNSDGPVLEFSSTSVGAFVRAVKAGDFDG